jgi:hypothetical protein
MKVTKLRDGHLCTVGEWTLPLNVVQRICVMYAVIRYETEICRNPHNSTN